MNGPSEEDIAIVPKEEAMDDDSVSNSMPETYPGGARPKIYSNVVVDDSPLQDQMQKNAECKSTHTTRTIDTVDENERHAPDKNPMQNVPFSELNQVHNFVECCNVEPFCLGVSQAFPTEKEKRQDDDM